MSIVHQEHHRPGEPLQYHRKFSLDELGVDTDAFLAHVRPVYETLEWDSFDMSRGGLDAPTRKRALAEFALSRMDGNWTVERIPSKPYVQPTDHGAYNRTEPRAYPEVPAQVTDHPEVLKAQKAIADIVLSISSDARRLRMIFTFLRTVDEEGRSGKCALEGAPHMDGMDFIVSALVINRQNLTTESGESSVYLPDQTQLLKTVLQPGEGIFQDDISLLHHITNITRAARNQTGIRDMLGIDILLSSSSNEEHSL